MKICEEIIFFCKRNPSPVSTCPGLEEMPLWLQRIIYKLSTIFFSNTPVSFIHTAVHQYRAATTTSGVDSCSSSSFLWFCEHSRYCTIQQDVLLNLLNEWQAHLWNCQCCCCCCCLTGVHITVHLDVLLEGTASIMSEDWDIGLKINNKVYETLKVLYVRISAIKSQQNCFQSVKK